MGKRSDGFPRADQSADLRRLKWLIPVILLVAAAAVGVGLLVRGSIRSRESLNVTAASNSNVSSGYRDVTWQGKHYRYNNLVTAILFAGLDSDGEMTEYSIYTKAPRADSIQLVILDQKNQVIKVVGISRDTMTKIRKYALDGMDRGLMRDHLGYAYTYGNGGAVSCESLCEAVSILFYNMPIRDYVVVNRSSLAALAEIVGPVEVVVPNNDLAELDEAYSQGQTVVIDADNLEFYVRSRDTEVDFSNTSRMQRQQSYISAAMQKLLEKAADDPAAVWDDLQQIESCMQTNITRSRYLDLASTLKNVTYSDDNYLTLGGSEATGSHDEFYPDEESLLALVMDLFYIEQ